MATQKIVNLLDSSENGFSKFATPNETLLTVRQRWLITQKSNQLLTSSIESSHRDYSDVYFLVTWNIAVEGADDNTKVAFKNCAPFRKCIIETNEIFTDEA